MQVMRKPKKLVEISQVAPGAPLNQMTKCQKDVKSLAKKKLNLVKKIPKKVKKVTNRKTQLNVIMRMKKTNSAS